MAASIQGRRIAILATDGFEQSELTSPRQALEQAGATVHVVSPKSGSIQGFEHHDKGQSVRVDRTLADARPADYDAVVLPGGVINGDQLRTEPQAQAFVREMNAASKPVAVICHGGWLMVSAGLVKDRTLTSWPTLQDDIRNAGGQWVDREVVVDGNLVTSRKPDDLPAFNRAIVEQIAQRARSS